MGALLRRRWWAGLLALLPALLVGWCFQSVARVELPHPGSAGESLWLLDHSGRELGRVRAQGELSEAVELDQLSPWLVPATLAAEDARFFRHPGLDPLAIARALGQALSHGRIVSGASTLTQQLARRLFERPRGWLGKAREAALALRLEAALDKQAILAAYFQHVDYGPRIRGVQAASRYYFDKPAAALSLSEAATLAALVRGPTRYDPQRHPERLRARRDWVLGRMQELGSADADAVHRARAAPLQLHPGYIAPGAFHFVSALARGALTGAPVTSGVMRSTLDAVLQREVETALRGFAASFPDHRASAAAVIVVDNQSAAVRAYVGAPDFHSREWLGQNDGALALRQPGSALKPFVYALGMRDLGLHAASVLPDLATRFVSGDGSYRPQNYDRRFHGPVRLAPALAASLNVPAATLAERLGPERVAQFLRQLGFSHLTQSGSQYGPAIALGVAEVQLVELAAAYATLARGGEYLPLCYVEGGPVEGRPIKGGPIKGGPIKGGPGAAPVRVLPPEISRQITAILSDPRERAATFGREGPLEFDLPVAVKTGTSKGNRDNWAVGYTPERTVAVWVGNFDGSPMLRSSGATGAGPLFHAVMLAALRSSSTRPPTLARPAAAPEERVICALSGQLAGPACPERIPEQFWTTRLPTETCSWHGEHEQLPERYGAWAHASGRARGHGAASSAAVSAAVPFASLLPHMLFPTPHARFVLDGNLHEEQQQVVLSAQAPEGEALVFELDGESVCRVGAPFQCPWPLRRGAHRVRVRSASGASEALSFSVE
jgi:penicillin-binding protein 1C